VVKEHPESPFAVVSQSMIGAIYHERKDYDRSLAAFKKVLTDYAVAEKPIGEDVTNLIRTIQKASSQPVQLKVVADSMDYDRENGQATYTGNVVLTGEGTELKAEKVIVDLKKRVISSTGKAELAQGDDVKLSGDKLIYYLKSGKVVVDGGAKLKERQENKEAEQLIYYLKARRRAPLPQPRPRRGAARYRRRISALVGAVSWREPAHRFHIRVRARSCPFAALERLVPDRGEILDLGCGFGYFAHLLVQGSATRRVRGIDLDAEKIAVAERSAGERGNPVFEVADLGHFAPASCDAVLAVDVFYLLPYEVQVRLIRQTREALSAGGVFLLKTMAERHGGKPFGIGPRRRWR